jgi:hypothetical protein
MSTSIAGTKYTLFVSGITITSGGASNTIGGGSGREIPMLTSTPAIVGIGTTIANVKSAIPKNNFFILFPPLHIDVLSPIIAFTASHNQRRDTADHCNSSPFIFQCNIFLLPVSNPSLSSVASCHLVFILHSLLPFIFLPFEKPCSLR